MRCEERDTTGSDRTGGGEIPRELPRMQEQNESDAILDEGQQLHNQLSDMGVALFCNEEIDDILESINRIGQDGIDEGRYKNPNERGTREGYNSSYSDTELFEEFEEDLREATEDNGGIQHSVFPDMGSFQDPDTLGRNWDRENLAWDTAIAREGLCDLSHGQVEGLQREVHWDSVRRHELHGGPDNEEGDVVGRKPNTSDRLLHRASDSLPIRKRRDTSWYEEDHNNKQKTFGYIEHGEHSDTEED